MENSKLSVEAIEQGTVIDHIPAGKGLAILRQFKLLHYGNAVTVGFNLPSKTQGSKDIIKISGVWLDANAANRLAFNLPLKQWSTKSIGLRSLRNSIYHCRMKFRRYSAVRIPIAPVMASRSSAVFMSAHIMGRRV